MDIAIPKIYGLRGTKTVPGDKSISHRALMIGSIAFGTSEVYYCSNAADPQSTLSCFQQLGIQIEKNESIIKIHGKGKYGLFAAKFPLDAGNSGTTMRLLSGILVGQRFKSTIIGDSSLSQRPMKRVIEPLKQMGADINGSIKNTAPINISPVENLDSLEYQMPIHSAQVKSALIFAGLYANGTSRIIEKYKTRDHTERMLGVKTYADNNSNVVEVRSSLVIEGKKFFVPGDISAAAFLISAGLLVPHSSIIIQNVGLNPTRKKIIDIFIQMGGNIQIENEKIIEGEPIGDVIVKYSELKSDLCIGGADVVDLIDEIPILAVTAMFAEGLFRITDAGELRAKETDRIKAIVENMRLLGASVEEHETGFIFEGKQNYKGNLLQSFNDHRIAMAFGVAGLRIPDVIIHNAECVDISFPYFWKELYGQQ